MKTTQITATLTKITQFLVVAKWTDGGKQHSQAYASVLEAKQSLAEMYNHINIIDCVPRPRDCFAGL